MQVVELPIDEPNLHIDKKEVGITDGFKAVCTVGKSYPSANLTWTLNGRKVFRLFIIVFAFSMYCTLHSSRRYMRWIRFSNYCSYNVMPQRVTNDNRETCSNIIQQIQNTWIAFVNHYCLIFSLFNVCTAASKCLDICFVFKWLLIANTNTD